MNRIILSDGTEITGFTVNGNELHFEEPVDLTIFTGKMSPMSIDADDYKQTFNYGKLITWEGQPTRIAFTERSMFELINERLSSRIDYVAMMTDVDLPNNQEA